jgi:hypothetical protein
LSLGEASSISKLTFKSALLTGDLSLHMSGARESALNSTNSTLAGALSGSDSATNNASSSIQGACNAFSDGLDSLKLSFHVTTSNAGHNTLCSTFDTTNNTVGAR